MIIHSVRARNVLKYARLDLEAIPERGLIAISGANESGKTAIVETICLALFGRTFSLGPDEIVKSIRWGETSCSVELEFTAAQQRYRVARSLGADGVHGASLTRVGETEPLATGARGVFDALVTVSGFTFEQYLDSLYLAQREISTPQSQSDTIKAVAGGIKLEEVAAELSVEVLEARRAINAIDEQASEIREQVNALGTWEDQIQKLHAEQETLKRRIQDNESAMEGLHTAAERVTEGCNQARSVGRSILEADTGVSLAQWRAWSGDLSQAVSGIADACGSLDIENDASLCDGAELKNFVWELEGRLSAFDGALERCRVLRTDLATLLGEPDVSPTALDEGGSLPEQQEAETVSLKKTRRWHGMARFNLLLVLLLTLGIWGSWGGLVQWPESRAGVWIHQNLDRYLPDWSPDYNQWLFPSALGASMLTLLMILRSVSLGRRVNRHRDRCSELGRHIEVARHRAELLDFYEEMALSQALESLLDLNDEVLSRLVGEFREGAGQALLEEAGLRSLQAHLHDLLRRCTVQLQSLREDVAGSIGGLDKENEQLDSQVVAHDQAIIREQGHRAQAEELDKQIAGLRASIPEHEENARLLELAGDLVRGTCQELYSRFNRVLRSYTGEVMPKLTQDRYHHMQIDDDLAVRVFSSEKNDFATLEELSSGTQRQIMLAVRLAMAKALAEATVKGKQFIILDEPFAFFDQERIRSTLEALPEIDDKLSQVWVISQEFENEAPFKLHLACTRDNEEMVISRSA